MALEQRAPPRRSRAPAATVRSCSAAIAAKRRFGSSSAGTSVEVLARDLEARLRERHLEVVDAASGRTATRGRGGAARAASRRRERRAAAVPGREQGAVLRPGEHPRDRPQRAEVVLAAPAAALGREPIASSASSSTGVNARKKATKRRRPPRRARGRRACATPASSSSSSRAPSGGVACRHARGTRASSVAASAASRLR